MARLRVSPLIARVGQFVIANASGSSDDGGVASYRFDFGDGTVVTQKGAISSHAYARRGLFAVRVRVTDACGQSNIASGVVLVY